MTNLPANTRESNTSPLDVRIWAGSQRYDMRYRRSSLVKLFQNDLLRKCKHIST